MRPNMTLPQWLKTVLGQDQKIVVHRPDDSHSPLIRKWFRFSGLVQGVGFRYEAKITADELGLAGWAKNEDDGTGALFLNVAPAPCYKYTKNSNTK